jgi:small subunit ribosomal protein S1
LSIKQAAEGGEVAEEYREHFGEHAYDDEGNYIGPTYDASAIESAWEEYEKSESGERGDVPELPQSDASDHPPSSDAGSDVDAE